MSRRLRGYLRTLAMVGVAGALLFGNLTGAQADTAQDPAAKPVAEPTTADAAARSATVTLSPKPGVNAGLPSSAALPIITCRITVSTPEAGFISVYTDGVVLCNYPISEIY